MHVLLAVLGLLGAGACWWCRARYLAQAAAEVIDAAERARGFVRRRQFRKKAEASTISAIEDPRSAAVVLMVGIASSDGAMTEGSEREIRAAMRDLLALDRPEEELVFAKWATAGLADLNNLIARLAPLWTSRLTVQERLALYERVRRVAVADGPPDDLRLSALRKLRDRLGLVNASVA